MSSCGEVSAGRDKRETTDKRGLVVLEVLEPLVEGLCWGRGEDGRARRGGKAHLLASGTCLSRRGARWWAVRWRCALDAAMAAA